MTLSIDKNIPIPPVETIIRKQRFPYNTMEIGDSFFLPNRETRDIRTYINKAAKRNSIECWCAKDTKEGISGVRVWRVK